MYKRLAATKEFSGQCLRHESAAKKNLAIRKCNAFYFNAMTATENVSVLSPSTKICFGTRKLGFFSASVCRPLMGRRFDRRSFLRHGWNLLYTSSGTWTFLIPAQHKLNGFISFTPRKILSLWLTQKFSCTENVFNGTYYATIAHLILFALIFATANGFNFN